MLIHLIHVKYFLDDKQVELLEGDIVLTLKLLEEKQEMENMLENGEGVFDAIKKGTWPNGEVPYRFRDGFRKFMIFNIYMF